MRNDGTYATSLVSLIPSYTGSLSGRSCNILHFYDNNILKLQNTTIFNNLIISLGGSTSNITITEVFVDSSSTILSYDSKYNVVLQSQVAVTSILSNIVTILNEYYNKGVGVVISIRGSSGGGSNTLSKVITNYQTDVSTFTSIYTQSITVSNSLSPPILFNCTTLTSPSYACTSFPPINNAISYGLFSSTPILNYFDNLNDKTKGRRIDLNFYASVSFNTTGYGIDSNDKTTAGLSRVVLQSLLWAGNMI